MTAMLVIACAWVWVWALSHTSVCVCVCVCVERQMTLPTYPVPTHVVHALSR